MSRRLQDLTGDEWNLLSRDHTVFSIQVSGLEHHGPHLPVGIDCRESEEIEKRVCSRLESQPDPWVVISLPPFSGMVSGNHAGSLKLEVRGHVLRDYLVDTAFVLWKNGFRYFVVFTATLTPKQLTTIEEAGEILKRKARSTLPWKKRIGHRHLLPVFICAPSALIEKTTVWRSPLWPDPIEQGGHRDTSIALQLGPENVREQLLSGLIDQELSTSLWARLKDRIQKRTPSYWGSPRSGNATEGERLLREIVEKITVPLLQVLKGTARPEDYFRSGYGFFPSNRSLFSVWILSLSLIAILTFWILLNLQWMTEMAPG